MVSLPGTFLISYWNSSCYRQLLWGKKDLQLERPNELTGHPLQWHHPGKRTRYIWWLHSESIRHAQQYHCVSHEEISPAGSSLIDNFQHGRDFFAIWGLFCLCLSSGPTRSSLWDNFKEVKCEDFIWEVIPGNSLFFAPLLTFHIIFF